MSRTIDVSSEVVEWNYWDHEHLGFVHEGYNETSLLISNNDTSVFISQLKIPFINLKLNALVYQHRPKKNCILVYTTLFGSLQKTTIFIQPIARKKTKIKMVYEFDLPLYLQPFSLIIKNLVRKWNEKVWNEDLPLKLRRQIAIDNGFKDYRGIKTIGNFSKIDNECKLPVPKPKDTYLDKHRLKF